MGGYISPFPFFSHAISRPFLWNSLGGKIMGEGKRLEKYIPGPSFAPSFAIYFPPFLAREKRPGAKYPGGKGKILIEKSPLANKLLAP